MDKPNAFSLSEETSLNAWLVVSFISVLYGLVRKNSVWLISNYTNQIWSDLGRVYKLLGLTYKSLLN